MVWRKAGLSWGGGRGWLRGFSFVGSVEGESAGGVRVGSWVVEGGGGGPYGREVEKEGRVSAGVVDGVGR